MNSHRALRHVHRVVHKDGRSAWSTGGDGRTKLIALATVDVPWRNFKVNSLGRSDEGILVFVDSQHRKGKTVPKNSSNHSSVSIELSRLTDKHEHSIYCASMASRGENVKLNKSRRQNHCFQGEM